MYYNVYIDDKLHSQIYTKNVISIGDIIKVNDEEYTVRKIVHRIIGENVFYYRNAEVYCY